MNENRFNNEADYPPQPEREVKAEVIMPKVAEPGIKSMDLVVGHSDFDSFPSPDKLQEREEQRKLFEKEKQVHAEEKLRRLLEKVEQEKQNVKPEVAMRFTANKLRFDLLPIEPLIELTRVYDSGALKYDDNNWRKGMPWSQVIRPIFSHLFKWLLGQKIDKETGCHHLMMVSWNCFTLFTYELRRLGTDDRSSLGFAIDEDFNWEDNHLGVGLSNDRKKELKEKYEKERNARKG